MTAIKPTINHARKMLSLLTCGLTKGVGQPRKGEMCILAVKRFTFGLSHGDSCDGLPVGSAVRSLDIALNDSAWSSNAARAKGMRRLALAEFGSDTIDQNQFVKELALATIRQIVPLALREAAGMKGNAKHRDSLLEHAGKCEAVETLDAASAASAASAARAARAASYAKAKHKTLTLMADIAVEALRKCGSPGCKWLYLCDEKEAA